MRGKGKNDYIAYNEMGLSKSEDVSDDGTAKVNHYKTKEETLYGNLALAMNDTKEEEDDAREIIDLRRTSSTRDRIIEDTESSEALNSMVQMGGDIIKTDPRSKDFRMLLINMVNDSPYFKQVQMKEEKTSYFARLLCGSEHALAENLLTTDFLVDLLIIELLRFLALKVCLGCFTSNQDGNRMLALIPSRFVLDAWRSLLILPHMYADVCEAMGADPPIDIDEESVLETLTKDKKTKIFNLDSYIWTLDTYEILYNGAPSAIFWPRVEPELDRKNNIVYDDQEPGTKPDWKLTLQSLRYVINDTIEIRDSFDEKTEIPKHVKLKSKQKRRRQKN